MTIVSGVVDVTTFLKYRVFASKQTGNFLFLAVYVTGRKPPGSKIEQNVIASIFFFCLGNFVFGRLAHYARPRKRAWLLLTTSLQAFLVLAAAAIQWVAGPAEATGLSVFVIVALLSLAASGQTSLAVTVELAELNTTMVTGAMISTLNDPRLLDAGNLPRKRRLTFIASYGAGCLFGGILALQPAVMFFFASLAKLAISASFILNRGSSAGFDEERLVAEENYGLASPGLKLAWGD